MSIEDIGLYDLVEDDTSWYQKMFAAADDLMLPCAERKYQDWEIDLLCQEASETREQDYMSARLG